MKHIFLDTNVIIDFLANRVPFSIEAAKLFNFSLLKKVTIYVGAVSFNNIYYIMRQTYKHPEIIKILIQLQDLSEVVDVTGIVIQESLKSEFKDFEDAIQYNCAKTIDKLDCIVTRNTKDFKTSTIPIMTPKEFLTLFENAPQ